MQRVRNIILTEVLVILLSMAASAEQENSLFKQLENVYFGFGSGAGAWGESLEISADGSFIGSYSDSEMGSAGDGYPGGTIYWCDFTGKLSNLSQQSEYVYTAQIGNLQYSAIEGTEKIRDEIRYVAAKPLAIEEGFEVAIYLPGMPVSSLPAELYGRIGVPNDLTANLTTYNLYIQNDQESGAWFMGSKLDARARVDRLITTAEYAATDLV